MKKNPYYVKKINDFVGKIPFIWLLNLHQEKNLNLKALWLLNTKNNTFRYKGTN